VSGGELFVRRFKRGEDRAMIGGLAGACFVRAAGTVFLGEPRSTQAAQAHEASLSMLLPMGTLAARPFAIADGRVTGPGVFDMKAGIVQAVHAVASLAEWIDLDGCLLLADDPFEGIGGAHGRLTLNDRPGLGLIER
jgi:hypothetical protein